jgi:hypothetical protein
VVARLNGMIRGQRRLGAATPRPALEDTIH